MTQSGRDRLLPGPLGLFGVLRGQSWYVFGSWVGLVLLVARARQRRGVAVFSLWRGEIVRAV